MIVKRHYYTEIRKGRKSNNLTSTIYTSPDSIDYRVLAILGTTHLNTPLKPRQLFPPPKPFLWTDRCQVHCLHLHSLAFSFPFSWWIEIHDAVV
jgi:hypothetical protein